MKTPTRLDPDVLLNQIKEEERKAQRGRLKIFFGSSAGVGKTYAMLKSAHEQLEQGKSVLVGLVETHNRPETDALLEGLMLLQPLEVNYRGMQLREFDIDTALTRKPDIILVDELAHTNAPGSRHPKRWNDVVELLDAGLDVYTTLNVQHIESLSDLIAGTTGVWVKETIPDTIFDAADDVVLVDLDEDDLIQRLHEGKVYVAAGAMARASENFFRKQNLSALRELALRRTADRVGAERSADVVGLSDRLPLADKILVCINLSPFSAKLIRSTKRLATGLKAPWLATIVETSASHHNSPEKRRVLNALERMIERMGGQLITLNGDNIPQEIITYAKLNRITKIVIGRSLQNRFLSLIKESPAEAIIKSSGSIDVYVVTNDLETARTESELKGSLSKLKGLDFAIALMIAFGLSIPGFMLPNIITAADQALVYLTGIVIVAGRIGLAPSLFYAILTASSLQLFFVSKYDDLLAQQRPVLLTYIVMLLTGYVVASQAVRLRNQALNARDQAGQSRDLFEVTRKLASTRGRFPVSEIIAQHISTTMGCDVTIWMTNEEGHPSVVLGNLPDETYYKDFGSLQWAFENGQASGRGTETMPSASGTYFPLISGSGNLGVLGIFPREPSYIFDKDEMAQAEMLANLLASALDRVRSGEIVRQNMVERESEKLRELFVKAASGGLRLPEALNPRTDSNASLRVIDSSALAAITNGLNHEAFKLSKSVRRFMSASTGELSTLQLNRRPTSIADRVRHAIERLHDSLLPFHVQNTISDALPDINVDLSMCEQAIVSFLQFLTQTTPMGKRLSITALRKSSFIFLTLMQERSTLNGGIQNKYFDMLASTRDEYPIIEIQADLGVAASIIKLHGGTVEALNHSDGSAAIILSLPIA